jgi:hypothetical protein
VGAVFLNYGRLRSPPGSLTGSPFSGIFYLSKSDFLNEELHLKITMKLTVHPKRSDRYARSRPTVAIRVMNNHRQRRWYQLQPRRHYLMAVTLAVSPQLVTFLLPFDILADLLLIETNGRNTVAASPEVPTPILLRELFLRLE